MNEPFFALVEAFASAAERLAGVDVRLLLLAISGQLVYSALRATAWRNILRAAYPEQQVRVLDVAAANSAAAAVSAVTIGHAGGAVKAAIVRNRVRGSTFATIAATLGVVAVFDSVFGACSLFVAWQLGAVSALPVPADVPAPVLGALAALAAVLLVVGLLARERAACLVTRLRGAVSKGTCVLRHPVGYVRAVAAVQLLAVLTRVGVVFLFLHAFAIPASLVDALLVVVVMGLASTMPSGPGGAGTAQLAVVVALHGTAPAAAAISFSIGMQLVMTGFNVALGIAASTYLFGTVRPHLIFRHGRALLAAGRAG